MAINCPNPSHPLWEKMVAETDLHTAFATYMNIGEKLAYTNSKKNNPLKYKVERDFNLVKFTTRNGTPKTLTRGFDRNSMAKIVEQIRDNYIGKYKIIRGTPDLMGEFSIEIEGYPIPKDDKYFNMSTEEIQALLYEDEIRHMYESSNETILPHDPEQSDYYRDNFIGYEQRPAHTLETVGNQIKDSNSPLETERRREINKQKEFLLEKFPQVTEIIEDYKMSVLGRLESNGTVIRINPYKMKEDTLFHEFGHLFIDLLGGMSNKDIVGAYQSLIGSDIYKSVLNRYKDLLGTDRFKKEVVAEALGLEAEQIWEEGEKRNALQEFLYNILNALKNMLGVPRSAIKTLAREMVKGGTITTDPSINYASKYVQEQRDNIDTKDPITVLNSAKALSDEVTFEEEGHKYFIGKGENRVELEPVSSIMNKAGYGIKPGEETAAVLEGQKLGTVIHKNAEAISNNVSEIIQTDSGYEMSKKAHSDLKGILNTVFGDKYTLLSEVITMDAEAQAAGTMDVFAVDDKGKFYIFDFKTKRAEKGFKYYDSSYKGARTQREVNGLQLSLYKRMLKRSLGIEVGELNVVAINAAVNKYNRIMGLELDTNISSNGIIPIEYNPLANELLRSRVKELKTAEKQHNLEDIDPESLQGRNIELASKLEDKYNRIYEDALNTLRQRLQDLRNLNRPSEVARIEEALDQMAEASVDPKRGIAIFVNEAVKQIKSLHNIFRNREARERNGEENVWDAKTLMRMYEYLSIYDILDDISGLLISEGVNIPNSQTSRYQKIIDNAISTKNFLRNLYKEKGSKILAESHYHMVTRVMKEEEEAAKRRWTEENSDRIKNMKIKDIDKERNEYAKKYIDDNLIDIYENTKLRFEQELIKANSDIGYMARWLDTVLNTDDMVTAAMVKNFVVNIRSARLQAIDKRQDMIPLLRELEEFQKYSMGTPVEKLYDFMLERDDKGNLTGHILRKFKSSLIQAENDMYTRTKNLSRKQMYEEREKWRKENGVRIDFEKLSDDWIAKAKEMKEEGLLSDAELQKFIRNESLPYNTRNKKLSSLINVEAADELIKWKQNNVREYYQITNPKWVNKEWHQLEEILKNPEDPRTKFYNFILDLQNEADSFLPQGDRLYTALPAVSKSIVEAAQSGRSIKDIAKAEYSKRFKKHSDDIDRGHREGEIPMFFLPTFYQRGDSFNLSDQSYDLASIYNAYYKMAVDYRYKNEIIGEMELAKKFIESRKYIVRDSKGNPIKKLFNNAREKELTKDGQVSLLAAQVNDFFQSDVYGKRRKDEGEFEILGLKIDQAKLIDSLSGYSAINMLGLNFVQGLSNVTYGEIQNIIEAIAGEHFTVSDLNKGSMFYFNPNNFADMLGDIGSRSPSSLIGLLSEKFDVLNEYEGGIYRKSSKFAQLMQSNSLFFTSQMGEHFMQNRIMLAMLGKIPAKNSKGEVIGNMLEMYEVDRGKLKIKDEVDLEMSNWTDEKQILFGEKVKRILSRIHGEYGNLAKNAIQRSSMGRAALMFRKFMYPGYDKRYGKLKHNEFLEEFTEGSYRQMGRFAKTIIKDLGQLKFALLQEDFKKLLPRERANIARAISEISFMLSAIVLGGILTSLQGEADDDREKWALSLATYVSKRARSELMFYINPSDAMNILVSPAASISMVENLLDFSTQLLFNPFDRYETGPWKDRLKISKKAMKLTPGIKQWYRMRDIEEAIGIFDFN